MSNRSKNERDLINAIHMKRKLEPRADAEFEIFQQMLPAIREVMKAGGGADAILKKSGPYAAYKLVNMLNSEKEEVALKASEKILAYDQGKPVERSVNIYGDISRMNEADVDNQILHLLQKTGAQKLLETTLDVKAVVKKQTRKPRKSDPLKLEAKKEKAPLVIEADYTDHTEGS